MPDNPFKKMMAARQEDAAAPEDKPEAVEVTTTPPVKRGRGRPAGGKRSDPGWIGRTYYIQEQNDIASEVELALLRSQGIDIDKSDLVDSLVDAWVRYRRGEDVGFHDISPRRED